MPPVIDQWNVVLAAPLPFFLALVAVTVVIWAAMQWRYKAVNEKTRELYELLNKKTDLAAEMAIQTQVDLKATNTEQAMQIENLKAQQNLSEETKAAVADMARTSSIATYQLKKLGAANNAISKALSDSRRLITSAPLVTVTRTTTCPICGAEAEELPSTGDFQRIHCPNHDEFEVSGTAMSMRGGKASSHHWETALERAKLRAESGKRPRIMDSDFP